MLLAYPAIRKPSRGDREEGFHSQLDGSNLKAGTSLSSSDD